MVYPYQEALGFVAVVVLTLVTARIWEAWKRRRWASWSYQLRHRARWPVGGPDGR